MLIISQAQFQKCFLVHIACLVELDRVNELYALGHALVKLQPDSEVTWYTVGCYYYATGQYTTGKKFLSESHSSFTSLPNHLSQSQTSAPLSTLASERAG